MPFFTASPPPHSHSHSVFEEAGDATTYTLLERMPKEDQRGGRCHSTLQSGGKPLGLYLPSHFLPSFLPELSLSSPLGSNLALEGGKVARCQTQESSQTPKSTPTVRPTTTATPRFSLRLSAGGFSPNYSAQMFALLLRSRRPSLLQQPLARRCLPRSSFFSFSSSSSSPFSAMMSFPLLSFAFSPSLALLSKLLLASKVRLNAAAPRPPAVARARVDLSSRRGPGGRGTCASQMRWFKETGSIHFNQKLPFGESEFTFVYF